MKLMKVTLSLLAIVCSLLSLTGCLSSRERMQMLRKPQNNVFQAKQNIKKLDLVKDQPAAFALWNKTRHQSIHVLQLRPDAKLTKRFHESHDLVLQCLEGSAIITLEGERHFVEAPATVVIPRYLSYEITPHKTSDNFTAMAVYSPVFENQDCTLMDE